MKKLTIITGSPGTGKEKYAQDLSFKMRDSDTITYWERDYTFDGWIKFLENRSVSGRSKMCMLFILEVDEVTQGGVTVLFRLIEDGKLFKDPTHGNLFHIKVWAITEKCSIEPNDDIQIINLDQNPICCKCGK